MKTLKDIFDDYENIFLNKIKLEPIKIQGTTFVNTLIKKNINDFYLNVTNINNYQKEEGNTPISQSIIKEDVLNNVIAKINKQLKDNKDSITIVNIKHRDSNSYAIKEENILFMNKREALKFITATKKELQRKNINLEARFINNINNNNETKQTITIDNNQDEQTIAETNLDEAIIK